uniref:Clusterin n=1 Tax=Anabas testudineus TaxID=64144 RepID=A0A3Q1HC87_ANATE
MLVKWPPCGRSKISFFFLVIYFKFCTFPRASDRMRGLLVQILCMSLLDALSVSMPQLNYKILFYNQYVDMEIKQALLGVKQMKGMMGRKEEKHKHLMDALRYSRDKTKLVKETQLKLDEAEQQCRDLTEASFTECRPCLEDTCKAFYTSMCRRGFASFSFKPFYNQNKGNSESLNQQDEGKADLEVLQAEASFSQLQSNISLLYNQSLILVKKMQQVFGHSFLVAFTAELQPSSLSAVQDGSNADLLRTVDHILDSVSDFGKNVLEELSSTVADVFEEIQEAEDYFQQSNMGSLSALGQSQDKYVCRRLRRQASECWQLQDLCETCKDYLLKECPSVQQLHSEMEEMYMLLNASRQQYDDRLQLVQRHTADTQGWLNSMDDKYGWVSQLSSNTVNPLNIFNVIRHQMKEIRPKPDSSVVVTVLNAAPLTVLVPADLDVNDPAFIQYAAREALTIHKRTIRGNGSVALVA